MAAMPDVHPTAIVDDRAQLGENVSIGPWCLVEGDVSIGDRTRLVHRVSLCGPLRIGADNVFYPGAAIGYAPQDRKFDPDVGGAGVTIGDRNILREGVTVHRATGDAPTSLGNDNFLMVNSHLAHDCRVGDGTMLANGALLAGHVDLADNVILGGNATVHQFCRVGRMAMISGLAGVSQDLPPFCVCYHTRRLSSLNLVGLRRAGYRQHIRPLQEAFNLFFRRSLSMPVALEKVEAAVGDDPLVQELLAFVRDTERGITAYSDSSEADSDAS